MQGRILQGIGGFYTAMDENGETYILRAQRKLRHDRMKPKAGDIVEMEPGTGEEDGWIVRICDRRNELVRPPVANIDVIVLTASCAAPQADLLLLDRMLIAARRSNIEAMLVITKTDLDSESADRIAKQYAGADVCVLRVSAQTGEGLNELRAALQGRVHALAGQSGAGKSSLINALYGTELETGSLSEKIDRGKNTTRKCELIPLQGGGMVLDTPGFSLLETELFDPVELKDSYPEFAGYEGKCYFQPCYHASEPKCAAREALDNGQIDPDRYERYVELLNEMKLNWRNRYD